MPRCEKCWADSRIDETAYRQMLKLRARHPCTPEQQAGPDATSCEKCDRMTRHQICGICTACGDGQEGGTNG